MEPIARFEELKDLCLRYRLVNGQGTIKKDKFGERRLSDMQYYVMLGSDCDVLIVPALCDGFDHVVDKDGEYSFEALLAYYEDERAYMEVLHIEYFYIGPEIELRAHAEPDTIDYDNLPF